MPTPHPDETERDYIGRCVASGEVRAKHPDQKQALAVCYGLWDEHRKSLDAGAAPAAPASPASPGGGPNTYVPGPEGKRDKHYVVERGVAVLDEFDLELENGEKLPITKAFLEEVIANNRKRIEDTGDYSPIIIGHTRPGSETEKAVLGFATNFRLGKIGRKKPRFAILVDNYYEPDKAEIAKQYPRRSVELYLRDKFIDSIALLGGTTPRRSLGLRFSKSNSSDRLVICQMATQDSEPEINMAEISLEDIKKLFEEMFDAKCKEYGLHKEEGDEEQLENDSAPEGAEEEKKAVEEEEKKHLSANQDAIRLERDQAKAELVRLQRERDADRKALDTLATQFRKTQREAELKALWHEGYVFDVPQQLQYVLPMDDKVYAAHLSMVKTNFVKAPLGQTIPTEMPMTEAAKLLQLSAQARDMAIAGNGKYEENLKKLLAEQKAPSK